MNLLKKLFYILLISEKLFIYTLSIEKTELLNNQANFYGFINDYVSKLKLVKPLNDLSRNNSFLQNTFSSFSNSNQDTLFKPKINYSLNENVNQVVFTPKECGRSFDIDFLEEDLTKLFNSKEVYNKNIPRLDDKLNKLDLLNSSSLYEFEKKGNLETVVKNLNLPLYNSDKSPLNNTESFLNNGDETNLTGEKRIINGQIANPGQFPWQVSIQVLVRYPKKTSPPSWRHICGGSIINSHWILTAAHCLEFRKFNLIRLNKPNISIVAGSLSWNNSENVGQRIYVKEYKKYYDPFDAIGQYLVLLFDIALIKLEKPLVFKTGENGVGAVERICLPKLNDHTVNNELRISGWGSLSEYPLVTVPLYLRTIDLPLVNDAECDRRYWPIRNHRRFLCAGYLDDSQSWGICMGDSGSPLIQRNIEGKSVLIGIASAGRGACGNQPATYARISMYRDWIKMITGT